MGEYFLLLFFIISYIRFFQVPFMEKKTKTKTYLLSSLVPTYNQEEYLKFQGQPRLHSETMSHINNK
jgi:hypothetical protein